MIFEEKDKKQKLRIVNNWRIPSISLYANTFYKVMLKSRA